MILRRWSWLVAVPLALVAAAVVVQAVFLRRDVRSELGDDLLGPLQVTHVRTEAWSGRQIARAQAIAASLATGSDAAGGVVTSYIRSFEAVARGTRSIDSSAVWLLDAEERVLAAVDTAGVLAPRAGSGGSPLAARTVRCGARFCAEARAVVGSGAGRRSYVVLRTPITDATLAWLHAARRTRRGRTSLLIREGDSLNVVASFSRDTTSRDERVVPWADAPAHVRSAFTRRWATGTANEGLAYESVLYGSVLDSAREWVLLREMDGEALVVRLLKPLAAEIAFVATLFLLTFAYVRSRRRAASMRRDRELAQVRADFIAAVSHELRTPLSQIRMFAELLRNGTVRRPDEIQRSLNVIEKEAGRLSILVDNILNYARLSRKSHDPDRAGPLRATDVARDVGYTLESFAPLAREKGVRLESVVDEPGFALVDSQALRQILLNFLENAVKYGPSGQTVTIAATATPDKVRASVADEGPGVSEQEHATIWLPFERGAAAQSSTAAGAGIGLSVVRDLVAQHSGTVWVEPTPSGGARFVVEFQRAAEPSFNRSPSTAAAQ